ncbi:migration and invasion-inhibitory protein-like [Patiria miniata]|uniref:Migration and invasion inhibitory protein n=1 Tax=Patiria miniata TaxID=46514 RepID=A0A914AE77_PATMI|nr:migration and invasion-inhibitory protein-like [Patiria miniata]XP_038061665.1 migration and invasion-inhibitory protein-like [Patiria miniata]
MTEDLSDMERLRAQNLSLLKELQKGQRDLRASIRSTGANRGSPLKESSVKFQRDLLDVSTMSSVRHKPTRDAPHSRLTSTPKHTNSATKPRGGSHPQDEPFPNPPVVDPVPTATPTRLYESFLSESHSTFGRSSGKRDKAKTVKQTRRKTPGSSTKGTTGSIKRKSRTPRKSPKYRTGASVTTFTPSPNKKGPKIPYSVRLETSSLLPPPLSEKENLRGQGSRYGYRRPLDLAHEESYYQLNRDSPLRTGPQMGQLERSFAGQLLADGNDRRQRKRSQEVTTQPKSILLTPGTRLNKSRNRVSFRRSPSASATFDPDDSLANRSQPLLGYDWIAGLLDSDAPVSEHSEAFFDELRQFRQANREECIHKATTEKLDVSALTASVTDDLQEDMKPDRHTCIHNYTLNPRLFAVPLHGTQNGQSLCAICNDRRKPKQPGASSPSYIRVSIPRSTLASPYRLRPHRRKSYDPTDSVGLSQHCLAGWQSSKPSMLPTASNIDLKGCVDKMASSALNLMSYPSQEPSFRCENAARISKHTQELLNRSHALQLDLQKLERVGMSVARLPPRPHSTSYPVL